MNTLPLLGAALNTLALPAPGLAGRLLAKLWVHAGPPRAVAEAEEEVHDRARIERVNVGEWDVATYAWGDGVRPVLLVHGWRSRASRLAPLVDRLLELGYSPVSWDAPGHGATGGATGTIFDARRIMTELAARHGHFSAVLAHSLGAPFAVHALREGLPADRAVLISGVSDFAYTVAGFEAALRLRPRAVNALHEAIQDRYFDSDPSVWERLSASYRAESLTQSFLLLHDDQDRVVPPGQSRRTAEALGERARLITTDGLGHSGILSDGRSLDRITGFVQNGFAALSAS